MDGMELRHRTSNSGTLIKRKILIVGERFFPEEFRINDLARDWIERGHQVSVLTQVPSYPQGYVFAGWVNTASSNENWNSVKIHRVRTVTGYTKNLFKKLLNYFNFMLRGMFRVLKPARSADVIFSFNTGPLTSAFPAVFAGIVLRKPVIIWTQDLWPDTVYAYGFRKTPLLNFALDLFVGFMYKHVTHVLISCRGFEEGIRKYAKANTPVEYIPNWADKLDESLDAIRLSEKEKINFTFAGNIGRVQNLDQVLKAFAELDENLAQKAQLNFIGDGSYLEELKKLTQNLGLANVVFWGRKASQEMAAYYSSSDVLIISLKDSPLFRITVPSKFQTYLAAQKAILSIVGGEVNRLVVDNKIGIAASPENIQEIKLAFEEFILLTTLQREEIASRAQALLNAEFNQAVIFEKLNDLICDTKSRE
jgi:glycosyltransferase involved in cell wall biosynthesis